MADFGLARSIVKTNSQDIEMSNYIATRWYRSPEIIVSSKLYTKAVDLWCVGCILGEMIN